MATKKAAPAKAANKAPKAPPPKGKKAPVKYASIPLPADLKRALRLAAADLDMLQPALIEFLLRDALRHHSQHAAMVLDTK